MIYLSSDGYKDQLGFNNRKRYGSKRLQNLLVSISHLEAPDQKKILEDEFNTWKCIEEQTDDVCLLGIRF